MKKSSVETPSTIVPFQFESKEVRTIKDAEGNPWFVARDVCDILGLDNVTKAMLKVPDNHKGVNSIQTLGGNQTVNVVDEPGLYRLILRSDKPQAEPFMEWVTSEVLPQIRKTGTYTMPSAGMKLCTRCGRTKPFSAFDKNPAKHDGYSYSCKECTKELARIRYNSRKVNAGITAETPAKALPMEPAGESAAVFNRILGDLDDAVMARKMWKIFHDISLVFIGRVADIEKSKNITDDAGVTYDELFARIERLEVLKFGSAQSR
jgi:prophage antirepressor-like protein